MITFASISQPPRDWEIDFLYQILVQREHSISHKQIPSFEQHRQFVLNHPYKHWIIVSNRSQKVGAVYVCFDNSVGIHILPGSMFCRSSVILEVLKQFKPVPGRASSVPDDFVFNVADGDIEYEKDLIRCGAVRLQATFCIKEYNDNRDCC